MNEHRGIPRRLGESTSDLAPFALDRSIRACASRPMLSLARGVTRWLGSWRAARRLAHGDMARHRLRTIAALILIAGATAGLVIAQSALFATPDGVNAALRKLPPGVQADITTLAIDATVPLAQDITGYGGMPFVSGEKGAATAPEIRKVIQTNQPIYPYYVSDKLLAVAGGNPGNLGTDSLGNLANTHLYEAPSAILPLVMNRELETGRLPKSNQEIVVGTELAKTIGVDVGDILTLNAPPDLGWMSEEGMISKVAAGTSAAFRVVGLTPGADTWSLDGWFAAAFEKQNLGLNRHFLMLGDDTLTWNEVKKLNAIQSWAISRAVLENPPAASERYPLALNWTGMMREFIVFAGFFVSGGLLLLATLTPAIATSALEQRRFLAIFAAGGARERDLYRVVSFQGVALGLAGGLIGAVIGTGASLFLLAKKFPDPPQEVFNWQVPALALLVCILACFLAALPPARTVSKLSPVAALRPAATSPRVRASRIVVGFGLLLGAAALGFASLVGVKPSGSGEFPPQALLLFPAVGLFLAGLVILVRPLVALAARRGSRLPLPARLGFGDAASFPERSTPGAIAVMLCVLALVAVPVFVASMRSSSRDAYYPLVEGKAASVTMRNPFSNTLDALAFDKAAAAVGLGRSDRFRIYGFDWPSGKEPGEGEGEIVGENHAVSSVETNETHPGSESQRSPTPQPKPGYVSANPNYVYPKMVHTCPENQAPTIESTIKASAPFECSEQSQIPGLSGGGWIDVQISLVEPGGVNAAGKDPVAAARAEKILAHGGVVVNAAWLLDDGKVTLAYGGKEWSFPGALVPYWTSQVTVSESAAKMMGLPERRLAGEIWENNAKNPLAADLNERQVDSAVNELVLYNHGQMSLTQIGAYLVLIAAAWVIVMVSLVLAKASTRGELATLEAVGARPRFLRNFSMYRAVVVLSASGLGLAGIPAAYYLVSWMRVVSTEQWRRLVIPSEILAWLGGFALLMLGGAWVVGLTRERLVTRRE